MVTKKFGKPLNNIRKLEKCFRIKKSNFARLLNYLHTAKPE